MFKVRNTPCSFNETEYEEDKDSFGCQGSINVYHCLLDEKNRSGEICIQSVWVQPNYCPEYNTGANTLDTVPCNKSNGSCPGVVFRSNEVYKYSVCLNKTFTADKRVFGEHTLPELWVPVGAGVLILISVLLIVGCVVYQIRRKNNRRNRDEERLPLLPDSKEPFYKSAAFHEGVNFIKNGGKLVCLIGKWGSGKTATANQIYMSVTNTPPKVIKHPLSFDIGHQPVIFDEAISKDITDIERDLLKDKIIKLYENMSSTGETPFIIITLNEDMEHCCDFVKPLISCEEDIKFINLSKKLTKGDRTQILHSQFETYSKEKDFSKIEKLALTGKDSSLGYPEICALFCRCSDFLTAGPVVFCNRPLHYLASHLEKMYKSNDYRKFLLLVYMSLNEMKINLNDSNDMFYDILDSVTHDKIRISRSLGNTNPLERGMSESADTGALEASSTMAEPKKYDRSKKFLESLIPREFVDEETKGNIYRLQHYVIKRMTLIVFGSYEFEKLLQFSKREDLKGWVKGNESFSVSNPLTNLTNSVNELKPVLIINGEQWKQYQSKMG